MTDGDLSAPEIRFRALIAGQLGLSFDDGKLAFLAEVLKRRTAALHLEPEQYLERLSARGLSGEPSALAEELTVGETYFFRNREQFAAFSEIALPERLAARAASRQLRILSAGSSSGEEAYSIAITLREQVPMPPWRVDIRAIDANPAVLTRARAARYSNWSLRETPADVRDRWFREDGRDFVLAEEIRAAVTFMQANLAVEDAELWAPASWDIIFCRNVIMYFTPPVVQAVIGRLTRALAPGGFLFLGSAETLRGLSTEFHLVHTHGAFYYRRREPDEVEQPGHREFGFPPLPPASTLAPAAAIDVDWFEAIEGAARRIAALTAQPSPKVVSPAPRPAAPMRPMPRVIEPEWTLSATLDLLQRERYDEALSSIGAMPAAARRDRDVLLLQAVLMVQSGRVAAAGEVCRGLLADDEMNAGAYYVLGLCFESTGNRDAALHHYETASHLDASFALPHLHLGLLARRGGDREGARAELETALTLLWREMPSRLLLFGGGFTRDGLVALCESELRACGGDA